MAGEARIVFGVIFLIVGGSSLATIDNLLVGLLFLALGIALLVWGFSSRENAERLRQQQTQSNALLQQQMQMTAMQSNRPAAPVPYAPNPQHLPPPPPGPPAERYCPVCGAGNARAAAFCQKCGKPLPPPP